MKKLDSLLWTLLAGLFCSLAACSAGPLPAPNGPYLVGSCLLDLSDFQRNDPHVSLVSGPRRILVRAWYPAAGNQGCQPIAMASPKQLEALVRLMDFPRSMAEGQISQSWQDADILRGQAWPVVIFNHGSFSLENQNFVQLQNLASNGYVVFALNHPYESLISEFPDGSVLGVDELEFRRKRQYQSRNMESIGRSVDAVLNRIKAATTLAERKRGLMDLAKIEPYAGFRADIEIRVADNLFLRHNLEALNTNSRLAACLDTSRVAIMGHSLGGISAVESLLRRPDAFNLAINLDGPQLLWDESREISLRKPVLFLHSTAMTFGTKTINMLGVNAAFVDSAQSAVYEAGIRGMGHFNFCDLSYIPFLRTIGMLGPIDGQRGAFLNAACVQSFLDKYLKNIRGVFPDQVPPDWPELLVRSRNAD